MEENLQEDSPYLNFEETRVLGSLAEKAIITPENYPISLNALTNACNQKTSRYPRTELVDEEVQEALDSLRYKKLVMRVDLASSRIPRFEHRIPETLNLDKGQTALLIVLMLRGPQTIGELRTRVERMHPFADLEDVEETLTAMRQREVPLTEALEPATGQKEIRYYHLLTDPPEIEETAGMVYVPAPDRKVSQVEDISQQIERMREEIDALRSELRETTDSFREFKKQFGE
ncbi:MAG: hypothetical protein CMI31_12180 [Opitutae bacterium]|nr:hypothetical protein [Opitutae bacterium]